MKVVINRCFGGFGLSAKAVARIAELQGRECYFFTHDYGTSSPREYIPWDGKRKAFIFYAFDIPNPNEVIGDAESRWHEKTLEERQAHNALYGKHALSSRPDNRADPFLVQAVEELGREADGSHAELEVVEIPVGVQYTIEEYDGMEHVAEVHRTWS